MESALFCLPTLLGWVDPKAENVGNMNPVTVKEWTWNTANMNPVTIKDWTLNTALVEQGN